MRVLGYSLFPECHQRPVSVAEQQHASRHTPAACCWEATCKGMLHHQLWLWRKLQPVPCVQVSLFSVPDRCVVAYGQGHNSFVMHVTFDCW